MKLKINLILLPALLLIAAQPLFAGQAPKKTGAADSEEMRIYKTRTFPDGSIELTVIGGDGGTYTWSVDNPDYTLEQKVTKGKTILRPRPADEKPKKK